MRRASFLFALSLILLLSLFLYQTRLYFDQKLHIVFCNIGQGDGIFIRTPNGNDILVDGGPDKRILDCLFSHMPFWDRDIELVVLTHPHADHLNGLIYVLDRYTVKSFVSEKVENRSEGFSQLMESLRKQRIPVQYVLAGNKSVLSDKTTIHIVGPTQHFLKETSPTGKISESGEFSSLLTLVSYGQFSALLTGDSQARELSEAVEQFSLSDLTVLQLPHHGSKTGLNREILLSLSPKLAVISVGKNKYGHPTTEVLDLLNTQGVKVLRTDRNGEIEIVTDGKSMSVSLK